MIWTAARATSTPATRSSPCFELGAVPIINENDTVSVEELQTSFGDNDRLAAIVTNLIQAPLLVLLSDVDGLFAAIPGTRRPAHPHGRAARRVDPDLVRDRATGLSKGGMASKLRAPGRRPRPAKRDHRQRTRPGTLAKIFAGEPVGTLFLARGQAWPPESGGSASPPSPRPADLGRRGPPGDRGDGRSLLPIGVVKAVGRFNKGDLVALCGADGEEFARGLTNYTSRTSAASRAEEPRDCRGPGPLPPRGGSASQQHGGNDVGK